MKKDIIVLTPIFNDWDSFYILVKRLNQTANKSKIIGSLTVLGIDDGSNFGFDDSKLNSSNVKIIHLACNIGHQKAIALGLNYLEKELSYDYVIVMDSDGEDMPEDIEKLLSASITNPDKIIFASRSKRKESIIFKFFYRIFKLGYRILTGTKISFGNFSIIPYSLMKKLVNEPEIWTHYSGTVIKSNSPYLAIPIEKGIRFSGKSKMNLSKLVLHGLSAIAIQTELVAIRMLIALFSLTVFSFIGIIIVICIRLFTNMAIPGWATYAALGLSTFFLQTLFMAIFMIFIVLNSYDKKLINPGKDYPRFILKIENIN